ncbi:MAG: phosphate signaling complex protein PhoU [Methylococcaceae bacterium]|nr:phosphate signaling complex protein PhoU [Methylococcaceae bacterium]
MMNDFSERHIVHRFDDELNNLHFMVVEMGELVLNQLCMALEALEKRDLPLAEELIDRERVVNEMEVDADTAIFTLLAKRCPVAKDLRSVMTSSRVINNLERIGDEAAKLANFVIYLHSNEGNDPENCSLDDIQKIGGLAIETLQSALAAFEYLDEAKAHGISASHQALDKEFHEGLQRLMGCIQADSHNVGNSVSIVLMMKALERIGDHAQNIAEYVIFQQEGEEPRHLVPDFAQDFPAHS